MSFSKYYFPIVISYISLAFGLLTGVIVVNLHGLEVVGWVYYAIGLQQILGFAITFGIGSYSIRRLSHATSNTSRGRCLSLLLFHSIISFIVLGLFSLIVWLISDSIVLLLFGMLVWLSLIRFLSEDALLGLGHITASVQQA